MTNFVDRSIEIKYLKVNQPLGEYYVSSIDYRTLKEFTSVDIRRIKDEGRNFLELIGIQRPLNLSRVREIAEYVKSPDANFPTSIIISVDDRCAEINEQNNTIVLSSYKSTDPDEESLSFDDIAKIIDGQHRLEGLSEANIDFDFDLSICIFVGIDLAQQAQIFSTVNFTQTKVSKSIVYDLYDYAKNRSIQKSAHNIAVALDENELSPFKDKIKRLGTATKGRRFETLTQATVVESIMRYIEPEKLRRMQINSDIKRQKLSKLPIREDFIQKGVIFYNLFAQDKDLEIAAIIWNYFLAVSKKWPSAWRSREPGWVLNKTNGFNGLMRFLRDAYISIGKYDTIPTKEDFFAIFEPMSIFDDEFKTNNLSPGSSGQARIYNMLMENFKKV